MSEILYRQVLLERLSSPAKKGFLKNPTMEARLVNPLCGDEILLQLKVRNRLIDQAVYSGNGCAISQVSADFLSEYLENKKIEEIEKITKNDILNLLGINPGPSRLKCALLSLEVLKKAISK
jgi:nitrogen fixation NifU-like protein